MDSARRKTLGPGAILSRLVAILALALFALPQGLADRTLARAGVAAENRVGPSDSILIVQRQLPRAQLPGDDTADLTEQRVFVPAPLASAGVPVVVTGHAGPLVSALRFLPPVRGPPEV